MGEFLLTTSHWEKEKIVIPPSIFENFNYRYYTQVEVVWEYPISKLQ